MNKHYCHGCASKKGLFPSGSAENLNFTASTSGNTYKLDKFIKHTIITSGSGLTSTFDETSYESYRKYTINTLASGSVEVDSQNRKNFYLYATQSNGMKFINGVPTQITDTVKVVLAHDHEKIHAYPVSASDIVSRNCVDCFKDVLTGSTST